MLAIESIYKGISVLEVHDKISTAIALMDEQKINHLPIFEENTFLGLISENSILELSSFESTISQHRPLLKKIFAYHNQHIYDVAKLAYLEQTDIVPVLDEKGIYHGCITLQKLLEAFTLLTSATEEGAVFTLTMNINDLFISEIARLIESNDTKIINLYVTPITQTTKIQVTIKVNKTDISRIVQTLNRYNYIVDVVFQQNSFDNSLSDKYKLLMKYLSI